MGKKIETRMSAGRWNGEDGLDGYSQRIKRDLESAESAARTYIRDTVPNGPLNLLARRMLSRAVEFHDKVHSHIKDELNKLIQLNIPEDDALELVLEGGS